MSPMPPSAEGAFSMMRTACTREAKRAITSASLLWMAPEWPRPSKATICTERSMPSSASLARSTASTGASFSRVSGSCGPTLPTSTRMIEVSSGTSKPALRAIQTGDWPTTFALSLAPPQFSSSAQTPKMNSSSIRFSSAFARYACSRANSASASSAMASSRMTACSEAHTMPLSNAFESTMSLTARPTLALFSMKAGTLPAPTPSAGLPQEYAARTMAFPPVARMSATPGWFISSPDASSEGSSTHWMQFAGAPAATAASRTILAAATELRWADGWKPKMIGLRVFSAMSDLKMVVEVGLVTGVMPQMTPTGSAISVMPVISSVEMTPTVLLLDDRVRDVLAREHVLHGLVFEQAAARLFDGQQGQIAVLAESRDRCLADDPVDLLLRE